MWSQPISAITLLFLSNRYIALFGNMLVPITNFSGLINSTVRRQSTENHTPLMLSPYHPFTEVCLALNVVAIVI